MLGMRKGAMLWMVDMLVLLVCVEVERYICREVVEGKCFECFFILKR